MAIAEQDLEEWAAKAWGAGVKRIDPDARTITLDMDKARDMAVEIAQAHSTKRYRVGLSMAALARRKPDMEPDAEYNAPGDLWFQDPDWKRVDPDDEPVYLDFLPAPDLEAIGTRLINMCEELDHLDPRHIVYLWKRKGGTFHGKQNLGKCTKPTGLAKYFCEDIWIIWLAADASNTYNMTRRQVEAALYHELLHTSEEVDEEGNKKPAYAAHDFQGFAKEIERYGAWMEDLEICKKAWGAHQLSLFDQPEASR